MADETLNIKFLYCLSTESFTQESYYSHYLDYYCIRVTCQNVWNIDGKRLRSDIEDELGEYFLYIRSISNDGARFTVVVDKGYLCILRNKKIDDILSY